MILRNQFSRYAIVGVSSLGVDYGILLLGYHLLGWELPIAATFGFVLGLLVNFLLNKFWSFQPSEPESLKNTARQVTLYGVLVIFNLLFTNVFIYGAAAIEIGPEVSKIATTGAITLWNFILYKRVIFKDAPLKKSTNPLAQ